MCLLMKIQLKEQIEKLVHHMNQLPIEGQYKVYIIEDFEKLTVQGKIVY